MSLDFGTMTAEQVVAEQARRLARRAAGLPLGDAEEAAQVVAPSIASFEVFLSWSMLVSDNDRHRPTMRKGRLFQTLTKRYAAAKKALRKYLVNQQVKPLAGRLLICATLIEPDRRSRRDVSNYAKLVHDGMEGLAYFNDGQLDEVRWVRGAPNVDRPGLQVRVSVLP